MPDNPYPFHAILKEEPDPTNRGRVQVGEEYVVTGQAGSCFIVIADDGDTAMIHHGRFTIKRY